MSGIVGATDEQIFCNRISKLLKGLDGLVLPVRQCAEAAAEINRLCLKRDGKQRKFSTLVGSITFIQKKALETQRPLTPQESKKVHRFTQQKLALGDQIKTIGDRISEAYKPFIQTSARVRTFLAEVREVLDYIPANSPPRQRIHKEIERLHLFAIAAATPGVLPMNSVQQQLPRLRYRLAEFLEPSVDGRISRRRKIVNQLQKVLKCRGREQLAKLLNISDSAIRAAIRGDQTHSGRSAEEKILEACRKHSVDTQPWR
jgi:hypothetical protein